MRDYDREYQSPKGVTFTLKSLTHALDIHKTRELICDWWYDEHTHGNTGTREFPLLWVITSDREHFALATPWEVFAFVNGLASAHEALTRH